MTAGDAAPGTGVAVPGDPIVLRLAGAIAAAGGRALLVGGWVRDAVMGLESKDYDFEVHGLDLARLESVLASFGEVMAVGKSFGVLRVKGLDIDFSLPRRDSKTGRGHRGFLVEIDPSLGFEEAARRRDLTINSMGFDPLTGELLDPHGGREDIRRRVLRATDPARFGEDSLRALRAAQFRARFEMEPDAVLRAACAALDLSDLPGERILDELRKLLLKARRPSLGLEFLRETGLLRFFPELAAMVGVPQDPEWHPEGTVWEHTLLVVDEAAGARTGEEDEDLAVLLGALLHDVGKPSTTVVEGGRIRSPSHEDAGVPIARAFLERLRASNDLIERVAALVKHHLAPAQFLQGEASPKAYRRLARKLEAAGVNARILHRVALADHLGRTTEEALRRIFPAGDEFLRRAEELAVEEKGVKDVVLGRHLIARGHTPGPWFGKVLAACREVQDETGWDDPDRILDRVLEKEV
jgi:tRNA nucleotidyltransferase (CCA-adding enzyme)